ncbi:hypothetical protein RhiirA4_422767 [Rhizophagus irregularis]|uniref:Uncharacterized protein n=1 Tax=Rhizophagus irregularis TaxID=588596 RepID=A0A2I1GRG8_9GLOM|nr:hypothetical protein RhiirA4_422767 [Rhizophagus irregularis]
MPPDDYTLLIGPNNSKMQYYSNQIPRNELSDVLFNCTSPDYSFNVTQGVGSSDVGDYHIIPLRNRNILVKVQNCGIRGKVKYKRYTKKNCTYEDEVSDVIIANPGFFAYDWPMAGGEVCCWAQNQSSSVVKSEGMCTYFVVPGIDVMTKQFMRALEYEDITLR